MVVRLASCGACSAFVSVQLVLIETILVVGSALRRELEVEEELARPTFYTFGAPRGENTAEGFVDLSWAFDHFLRGQADLLSLFDAVSCSSSRDPLQPRPVLVVVAAGLCRLTARSCLAAGSSPLTVLLSRA